MDFDGKESISARELANALLRHGDRPVYVAIMDEWGRELPCAVRLRYALGGPVELYVVPKRHQPEPRL